MKRTAIIASFMLLITLAVKAQNDTMYVMHSGKVLGIYKVSDVDSVIFYKPSVLDNTVIDVEGNIYKTVTLGSQVWMAENLRTTRYSNGDLIGTTNPVTLNISGESTPKYQWPCNGDESKVASFGRIYTGYAMLDSRNVCPIGWHVPSITEWNTLQNYLIANGYNYDGSVSGNKLAKSIISTDNWTASTNVGAPGNTDYPEFINKSGFNARPSGTRGFDAFYSFGSAAFWWSTSIYVGEELACKNIWYEYNNFNDGSSEKNGGIPVRCVKD